MRKVAAAWYELRWMTVAHGVRDCAIFDVTSFQLFNHAYEWALFGLAAVPIAIHPDSTITVTVGKPRNASEMRIAHDERDDRLGKLLGYPACCRRAFAHEPNDSFRDTGTMPFVSWMTALGLEFDAVFHLLCRKDCRASARLAHRIREVGRREGYFDEMGWLEEMSGWPVERVTRAGVVDTVTPTLRVRRNLSN
jgi:hypothetical protein